MFLLIFICKYFQRMKININTISATEKGKKRIIKQSKNMRTKSFEKLCRMIRTYYRQKLLAVTLPDTYNTTEKLKKI